MKPENELKPESLRCICEPEMFDFESTLDIQPLDEVIGQERAVRAIDFGLNMKSQGYNIFVTGPEGTGKTTIVQDIVRRYAKSLPAPLDWCLVNNFKDAFRPRPIPTPSGQARQLAKSMNRFVNNLKTRLPLEFESDAFREKVAEIQNRFEQQNRGLFENLDQSAGKKGLMINKTATGFQTIPTKEGKALSKENFAALTDEQKKQIEENIRGFQTEIEAVLREANQVNQALQAEVTKLTGQIALFIVKNRLDIIRDHFNESPEILKYLDAVQEDIVENVDRFFPPEKPESAAKENPFESTEAFLGRYRVNVLSDPSDANGAPVIFESNPTFQNIFGSIEKKSFMGAVVTDFTMVQSGSLLQANGGVLIMDVEAALTSPYVWDALKRALQNKQLCIEDLPGTPGFGGATLRPEPIPLNVKVILLGDYAPFQILQSQDSKFNKIFKVRADFDYEVKRTKETMLLYARFIARVCKEENLLPFTPGGVASVVEYGEKAIASKNKLSLRFGTIVGIIKEADFWARKENAPLVTDRHVFKAFTEYRFRYNLYEEKVHEDYVNNTIMIDVDGAVTGQVNALAVYQVGDIAFGRPSRITAEAYMGKSGVINIEREAMMSGKTHDKGMMILSGYMGRTFAQKYPLSLSISITFEQSYSGIDGDSASSTELYAILSALSGIPIRQGIAVTGSVNQKGMIQAIGGVNHKIEGFFDVCSEKGLTGDQGVMIPVANVKNLMLKKSVIDAVKKGEFHIYQVADIEEGIEILTGVPSGKPDEKNNFPKDTVYGKVQNKLEYYLKQSLKLKKALGFMEQ